MKKLPKAFKKPISEKDWNKKILGKIYLPEDREFLESLKKVKGKQILLDTENLDKKQQKRLKSLSKVILANRKGFSFPLLVILVFLAGSLILWQFLLKDRILTRVAEKQLEQVFQAKVEMKGLEISLVKGFISLENLTIADKDHPMLNLVELSDLQASLDTYQLSKGRVHITELGFLGLKRGTARSTPGTLENTSPGVTTDPEDNKSGSPIEKISASLGKIDPQEILDREMENLTSPGKIEAALEQLETAKSQWEKKVSDWEGKEDSWQDSTDYIRSVKADSFNSLAEAQSTLTQLKRISEEASSDFEALSQDFEEANSQQKEITSLYGDIQNSINEDYQYLENFISQPGDQKIQWAAQIMEEQMGTPVLKYLQYYNKGKEWLQRLQNAGSGKPSEIKDQKRYGRSLPQGPEAPPRFVLVHGFASGTEGNFDYDAEIFDISSNPAKWDSLPRVDLQWDSAGTGAAEASLSLESGEVDFQSLHFDLGNQLESLGLESLSGNFSLHSDLLFQGEKVEGTLELIFPRFEYSGSDEELIARLVQKTLASATDLQVNGSIQYSPQGLNLGFQTELDQLLNDAMGTLLEESAAESLKYLKEQYGDQLAGPLNQLQREMGLFDGEVENLGDLQNQLNSLGDSAENKKREIEASVQKKMEEEAAKAADKAAGALEGLAGSLF